MKAYNYDGKPAQELTETEITEETTETTETTEATTKPTQTEPVETEPASTSNDSIVIVNKEYNYINTNIKNFSNKTRILPQMGIR
mgnify:CR=1 FL=1